MSRTRVLTFRDSISPAGIPLAGLDGVLLYANGSYAATPAQEHRFTSAGRSVVHIDVNGTGWTAARILDVERYDATPQIAAGWIPRRDAFRHDATIYVGRDNVPGLLAATSHITVPWWLIVADWTGRAHMPVLSTTPANVHLAGCQYLSTPAYDESCLTAEWLNGRQTSSGDS